MLRWWMCRSMSGERPSLGPCSSQRTRQPSGRSSMTRKGLRWMSILTVTTWPRVCGVSICMYVYACYTCVALSLCVCIRTLVSLYCTCLLLGCYVCHLVQTCCTCVHAHARTSMQSCVHGPAPSPFSNWPCLPSQVPQALKQECVCMSWCTMCLQQIMQQLLPLYHVLWWYVILFDKSVAFSFVYFTFAR